MVVCVVDTKINGDLGEGKAGAMHNGLRASPTEQEGKQYMWPRQVDSHRAEQILWKYYDFNIQHVMHNQQAGLTHDIRHRQIEHRIT